jgi:hypothetical protein
VTSLRRAGADDRPVVERLAQLEAHDLSDLTGALPDDDGRFAVPRLERFVTDDDHVAHLVEDDGVPVGFALVRPVEGAPRARVLRRPPRHAGGSAAPPLRRCWPRTRGRGDRASSSATTPPRGSGAVATRAVGDAWSEERRTHGDDAFGWITLDTSR